MNSLGLKVIRTSQVLMPGVFAKRLHSPVIEERAKLLACAGQVLQKPIVRTDYRIVFGDDEVGAAIRLGWEEIPVEMVDCSDSELAEFRRRMGLSREEIDELAFQLKGTVEDTPRGPGRPVSEKGLVQRRLAKASGVTLAAVRKRDYRERKARDPFAEPCNLLGTDPTMEYLESLWEVRDAIESAKASVVAAMGSLSRVGRKHRNMVNSVDMDRLQESLHSALSLIRGTCVTSICPACKNGDEREFCQLCVAKGYITQTEKSLYDRAKATKVGDMI